MAECRRLDVLFGEVVRRCIGPGQHADFPCSTALRVCRDPGWRALAARLGLAGRRRQRQQIPCFERPPLGHPHNVYPTPLVKCRKACQPSQAALPYGPADTGLQCVAIGTAQLAALKAHSKMSAGDKGCTKHLETAKLAAGEGAAGAKIGGRIDASGHCQEAPRALLAFDLHCAGLFFAPLLALLPGMQGFGTLLNISIVLQHEHELRKVTACNTLPTVRTEPDLIRMDSHRCTGDLSTSASKSAPVTCHDCVNVEAQ